jgi:transposase
MSAKSIRLRDEQRAGLLQSYRTTHDANLRSRCQIILLFDQGLSAEEIATITFFDHNTVLFWRRRFEEQDLGGLLDRPRSGRPSKSHSCL